MLIGDSGNDTLIGSAGNDTIHGGLGSDVIDGGTGTKDLLDYSGVGSAWSISLGAGGNGTAPIQGTDTYTGIEGVIGGSGANSITGNSGDNFLYGGGGDDTLSGAGGTDVLEGGAGNDTLIFSNVLSSYSGNAHLGGNDLASNSGDILDISGTASINLGAIQNSHFLGIETISMSGGSGMTLSLNIDDVIDLGDGTFFGDSPVDPDLVTADAIRISGEAGDTVNLLEVSGDWQNITSTISNAPSGYNVYAHFAAGNVLTGYAIIDSDVTVNEIT